MTGSFFMLGGFWVFCVPIFLELVLRRKTVAVETVAPRREKIHATSCSTMD
jgi:hypothetical protein